MAKDKPKVHCWCDYREHVTQQYGFGSDEWADAWNEPSATCLLMQGHDGPHEWTPDDSITISFSEEGEHEHEQH